jgi:hypothetical protein
MEFAKEEPMEFTEEGTKRLLRGMNTILNLYDIEGIPKEILDYLYYPVGHIAEMLNIPVEMQKTKNKDEDGNIIEEVKRFIMPENFAEWVGK